MNKKTYLKTQWTLNLLFGFGILVLMYLDYIYYSLSIKLLLPLFVIAFMLITFHLLKEEQTPY